jgi:chloride channel protein, CIC family
MKLRRPPKLGLARLSLLAIVVGVITGFGAVIFRALIGLIHNVAFLGSLSFAYDSSVFTPPSPWGVFIIIVPVIGGLIVTFLITNFAPEARGHGVPEVMDAIYYKDGMIRPVVAVIKSLASALSIGTGARSAARGRLSRSAPRSARRSGRSCAWRRGSASRWSPRAPAPASPRPSTRRSAA